MRHDRQLIAARVRDDGTATPPDYVHLRSKSEPLIWVSDAAAWCWQRGGEWRRRTRQLIGQINKV
ncbi:hypothetical protein G1H11_16060 [Phytoactinopolyspora alkaliphila]|uniref:Uncharacterized protein n=1 Tax=Phytoactinopolyspora alkaliphila TaxID=1783498 RepID=A0A6N9YP98_9ACTN|nr:hypothetical protein [Phytoactinopolyspora alkaliphila]NED96823.1 hypothetical protein [Phytoactinopolyspora alkaliphila]